MKEKEVYTKSYWDEEDMFIYNHFIGEMAVRQIEIWPNKMIFLSLEKPLNDGAMLYDQSLAELDLRQLKFITAEEFDKIWREP